MFQMLLIAYNNDDWGSLFGNPAKFGIGLFSVMFNIFFMLQHYVYGGTIKSCPQASANLEKTNQIKLDGKISEVPNEKEDIAKRTRMPGV